MDKTVSSASETVGGAPCLVRPSRFLKRDSRISVNNKGGLRPLTPHPEVERLHDELHKHRRHANFLQRMLPRPKWRTQRRGCGARASSS